MTMTAIQIREALKPMMQFAPAIIACIEIVESAEAAEKAMKPLEKHKGDLEKQIAELEARFGSAQAQVAKEKGGLNAFMVSQEEKREALRAEFTAFRAEHDRKMEQLGELGAQYSKQIVALEEEKKAKQAELDNVKKAFDAFKAAHQL